MSQEQQETQGESSETPITPGKRRPAKKVTKVDVVAISPHPSYWPIALALAIVVLLMGTMINGIVLSVGVVLVIGTIIGWALERR